MSFILDALKKAEAERQLGQIPTLHVQPLAALPARHSLSRARKTRLLAAAVLSAAAIATLIWLRPWQGPAPSKQDGGMAEPVSAPVAAAPADSRPSDFARADALSRQSADTVPPAETHKPSAHPAPAPKKTPPVSSRPAAKAPAAAAAAPAKAATPAPALAQAAATPAKSEVSQSAANTPNIPSVSNPAAGKPPSRRPVTIQPNPGETDLKANAGLAPENSVPSQRELPEQVQRELPSLAIGGYIYSDNPRERQLLVNRRLLHEGEEAAPGIVLERMMPKAAVFNYRGYRYRIAY